MDPPSDIYSQFKLPTQFVTDGNIVDTVHNPGPLGGAVERWRTARTLGRGTFGVVEEQRCIEGSSVEAVRAVKCLSKGHYKFLKASRRELEALVTFSNPKVPEVRKDQWQ